MSVTRARWVAVVVPARREGLRDRASAKEIRDWARSNGFKVPDRGRIPADVREAFDSKS